MSTGKREDAKKNAVQEAMTEAKPESIQQVTEEVAPQRRSIAVPPKAREELRSLLRMQNEAQERMRLLLATLEEALEVPAGWVIRDVDEGFVEIRNAATNG